MSLIFNILTGIGQICCKKQFLTFSFAKLDSLSTSHAPCNLIPHLKAVKYIFEVKWVLKGSSKKENTCYKRLEKRGNFVRKKKLYFVFRNSPSTYDFGTRQNRSFYHSKCSNVLLYFTTYIFERERMCTNEIFLGLKIKLSSLF